MFSPLLEGEPTPVDGMLKVPDTAGFGVQLNPRLDYARPHAR